jgi:exodeoxyribonuclease V alpha subunit
MSWPLPIDLADRVSDHQRAEYWKATQGTIGILGGGPGCGKTFLVGAVIEALAKSTGLNQIAIGAPTGKAAVRVTETLSTHGIPLRARTWHSLLRGGTDGGFLYTTGNPLPYRVLIGDESSMVDLDLMASIFRARAQGTLVLLVGDVNQLPPVGHGAPLRDLIAAGLPCGILEEIKRNSGGIVEACDAIRRGKRWTCGDNLRLVDCSTPDGQIAAMLANIHAARVAGADPIWDCQVVCPVNKKSPLARKTLNGILQRELNPRGETAGGSPFRVGDKLVNSANGRFPVVDFDSTDPEADVSDRGEAYCANGELARVLHVEDRLTIVQLDNPKRVIKIPRGKTTSPAGSEGESQEQAGAGDDDQPDKTGTGCSWDLGYCLSVHKSQGSEWPTVLVMLDEYPGARMVASREWLYTAISRAKSQCVLIGKKATADAMCRRQAIWQRKTLLKERLLVEVAKRELAEL